MKTICIIGSGRFGRLAAERLSQTGDTLLTIVDSDAHQLAKAHGSQLQLIQEDGIFFIQKSLLSENKPDWIIPALPVHLAAEWCLLMLKDDGFYKTPIPEAIDTMLPNLFRGVSGDVYVSHAGFKCPDSCQEPDSFCTVTGKPRKEPMFTILKNFHLPPFISVSIRSYQLAPGVGGYQPDHLAAALEEIKKATCPALISTACRCHGVLTGISKSASRKAASAEVSVTLR